MWKYILIKICYFSRKHIWEMYGNVNFREQSVLYCFQKKLTIISQDLIDEQIQCME